MKGISLHIRDTDEKVVDYLPGVYTIGRGNRLKCTDKRISHNHALLNVTPDKVTLTSTHVNPCFFKSVEGSNLTILKQNEPVEVKNGDTFGFLPDQFWYKCKFCDIDMKTHIKVEADEAESISSNDTKSETTFENIGEQRLKGESRKRELNESNNENNKKMRTLNDTENESTDSKSFIISLPGINNVSDSDKESQSNGIISSKEDEKDHERITTNEPTKHDQNLESTNERLGPSENRNADDNQPSSSTTIDNLPSKEKNTTRDRCWYGSKCYRKNLNHKKELSHPGDSDYESDANDDRPMCPFGEHCYRRNKTHRQQFKHPKTQVKLKDKKRRKKTTRTTNDNDSAEDDYDFDDPFIYDDSSDDYVADDDDSDSEWDPENGEDAEEEDMKRLVKEAKRFTKGAK